MKGLLWHPKFDIRAKWRPVALSSSDILLVTFGLIMAGGLRSYDYGTGGEAENVAPILRPAEAFMPMWAWSLSFGIAALVLAFGVFRKLHFFVWLGHGLLIFPYGGLAVGVICGAAFTPWGDGIRAAGALGLLAVLHFILNLRTGPRPLDPRQAQPVEVITAGGEGDG